MIQYLAHRKLNIFAVAAIIVDNDGRNIDAFGEGFVA